MLPDMLIYYTNNDRLHSWKDQGMKVLLVNPPRKDVSDMLRIPPLGLAYLAAMLERDGHQVRIIDAENLALSWRSFEAEIKRQKADLIGIGSYTLTMGNTSRAVKICRPYARYLVMGGYYVTESKQDIFKECRSLDLGIAGEGEISFPALVRRLEQGADPQDVPGVITRERFNPPDTIEDIDGLPFPARHLLPNDIYFFQSFPGKKVTSLLTWRGCPYQCTYCDRSVFGSTWRARSPQSVLDEMEEAVRDLDIGFFIIGDDTFRWTRTGSRRSAGASWIEVWRWGGNVRDESTGWTRRRSAG